MTFSENIQYGGNQVIKQDWRFPWTTPFCARNRCNLEGMTAKISVFFPEQNVDLTDLYTRFIH
jgi:hypothetical protein